MLCSASGLFEKLDGTTRFSAAPWYGRGVQLGRESKRTLVSSIDILDLSCCGAHGSQTLPKCESVGPLTYSCTPLTAARRLLPRKGPHAEPLNGTWTHKRSPSPAHGPPSAG